MEQMDFFDVELSCEASRRMIHRDIDAKCERLHLFISRSFGQQRRRMRERFDAIVIDGQPPRELSKWSLVPGGYIESLATTNLPWPGHPTCSQADYDVRLCDGRVLVLRRGELGRVQGAMIHDRGIAA